MLEGFADGVIGGASQADQRGAAWCEAAFRVSFVHGLQDLEYKFAIRGGHWCASVGCVPRGWQRGQKVERDLSVSSHTTRAETGSLGRASH